MARKDPRGDAAAQMMESLGGGGDMPPMEDDMGGPPPMDAPAPEGPEMGGGGIEAALAAVEAELAGLGEADAREVRTHLEAIREITSREGGAPAPSEDLGAMMDAPPGPEAGAEPPMGLEEQMPA